MFDKFGRAMDPTGICAEPSKPYKAPNNQSFKLCDTDFNSARPARELRDDFGPYINALFDHLENSKEANTVPPGETRKTRKVVIFIHGGLNTDAETIARSERSDDLLKAGYYPIFIGWKSSLMSSWLDSLLNVRFGRWYGVKGWPLAPLYMLGDALRSIGRAPIVWMAQMGNAKDNVTAMFAPEQVRQNAEYCSLRQDYDLHGQQTLAISKGHTVYPVFPDRVVSGAKLAAMASVKFVLSPFLDGIGSAAWSMMERRAHLLFYDDPDDSSEPHEEGNGGLAIFMRALRDKIAATQDSVDWDITLVAHSAGTIVANDILTLFPDIHFSRVVYMAAACSVSEYEHAVWPYLARPGNESTHFYHVILHDVSELKEAHLREVPPRGSLLVWIDDFFSHPVVPRDRTAGRFNNLMGTLKNTPDRIRQQVSVKVFGLGKDSCPDGQACPQQHDQFTNQSFWCENLRTPEPPESKWVDNVVCEVISIDDIIKDHARDADFAAVMAQKAGKKSYKSNGELWDHVGEMQQSIRAIETHIGILEKSLERKQVGHALDKRKAMVKKMKQAVGEDLRPSLAAVAAGESGPP